MIDPAESKSPTVEAQAATCPVRMSEGKPCGRRSLGPLINGVPYCLMHIPTGKDDAAFHAEFDRILRDAGDGVADFTRFVFPISNYPRRTFRAQCIFAQAVFKRVADFSGATFKLGTGFIDATFDSAVNFTGTTFENGANFSGAVFQHGGFFIGATFVEGGADLSGTTFKRDHVYFNSANFKKPGARFNQASFEQGADFSEATFERGSFIGATFSLKADFSKTTFTLAADFQQAKFDGEVIFRETNFRQDNERCPRPVFCLAKFSCPGATVFYKTYLGQALFHNCDVSKITFSSVEWCRRKKSDKRMVFEEIIDLKDPNAVALQPKPQEDNPDERDYSLIAELYQQLKKNYDGRKDYWTAGDFHYGELEMKRQHSRRKSGLARWLHRNLGLAAWYKRFSQYGESYMRPTAALLIVFAIFTLLFPLAGLERNENVPHSAVSALQQAPAARSTSELSYKCIRDFVGAYPGRRSCAFTAFFGNSLMTTVSVASFQKKLRYEPSYPWGQALALLEFLLTSILIALFLLAVRRQFRR